MCKTYDAIVEMKKHMETDILTVYIDGAEAKGSLQCNCECEHYRCQPEVVTLKDATIKCHHTQEVKELKMLNIPSMWIRAFYFECCEKH